MEGTKSPFIDNKRAVIQDDTQAQILRELKRQNALLEEQLALQREQKHGSKVDPATLTAAERLEWEMRRKNNAFLKPRLLTDEMCTFMGLPTNSLRSQTDVTKFISAYVKEHNCYDHRFKRRIVPDTKLAKLLRTNDKDEEKKRMERKVTQAKKKQIAGRQRFCCSANVEGYVCPLDKKPFDESGYEIDHIVELCNGGSNEDSNLQALCIMCHRVKTSRLQMASKPKLVKPKTVKTKIEESPPTWNGLPIINFQLSSRRK